MEDYKKILTNDDFGQCLRKLRKQPVDIVIKRKEEMEKCNHLFILLKEGEWINGFHSSDCCYEPNIVECVHCGLTNKFMRIEERVLFEYILHKISLSADCKQMVETIGFLEKFGNFYQRGAKCFNELPINLIKDEVLPTYHPALLYKLAVMINPSASLEGIFTIMKTLHSVETPHERLRLKTIQEVNDLLERYREYQSGKSLILVKTMKSH